MQQLTLRISIRWWSKDAENQKITEIFMPNGDLNWIANFIWGIADDVLRDVYVRGKYRDASITANIHAITQAHCRPLLTNFVTLQLGQVRVVKHRVIV